MRHKCFTLLILALIIASIAAITACQKKAGKEQIIEANKKLIEYVESDEYKALLKAMIESGNLDNDRLKDSIGKKMNEIAITMGFENAEQFKTTESIMNSPQVKEWEVKLETAQQETHLEIDREVQAERRQRAFERVLKETSSPDTNAVEQNRWH